MAKVGPPAQLRSHPAQIVEVTETPTMAESMAESVADEISEFMEMATSPVKSLLQDKGAIEVRRVRAMSSANLIADHAARNNALNQIAETEAALLKRVMDESNMSRPTGDPLKDSSTAATLDVWYRTIFGKVIVHDHYAVVYGRASFIFQICLILLNAVVSGLVFSQPAFTSMQQDGKNEAGDAFNLTTGILSVTVTVLAALASRLKLGELSDAHKHSKLAFVRLKRRMDMLRDVRKLPLVNPPGCEDRDAHLQEGDVHPDWKEFISIWEDVASDAPFVSMARTRELYRLHIAEAKDRMHVGEAQDDMQVAIGS